jgi:hypothetical protein
LQQASPSEQTPETGWAVNFFSDRFPGAYPSPVTP